MVLVKVVMRFSRTVMPFVTDNGKHACPSSRRVKKAVIRR